MMRFKFRERIRFVVNLSVFALIIVGSVFLFRTCNKGVQQKEWKLENHPLKVESIRRIAEISTVSFQGEVVQDTVEYYDQLADQVVGNITKLIDVNNWKHAVRGSAVKRRLTLIIGGEVRYGFKLNAKNYSFRESNDTVFVILPEPEVLDVLVPPSKTTVFLEHGKWNDNVRRNLLNAAIHSLKSQVEKMELAQKSKQQVELLLHKLVGDKPINIQYQ